MANVRRRCARRCNVHRAVHRFNYCCTRTDGWNERLHGAHSSFPSPSPFCRDSVWRLISRGYLQWHDNLWLLRQLLFLFLPILTHFLPPSRSETMLAVPALASARGALEQSVARLASLRYAHGAVMRDPTLRAAAGNWWERQRKEGVWAREDENVRQVAERLGRGFDEADPGEGRREGKLRTFARMAVERLKAGLAPTVQ